jgi:hypothetical protein
MFLVWSSVPEILEKIKLEKSQLRECHLTEHHLTKRDLILIGNAVWPKDHFTEKGHLTVIFIYRKFHFTQKKI